jgi:hypothetical protein
MLQAFLGVISQFKFLQEHLDTANNPYFLVLSKILVNIKEHVLPAQLDTNSPYTSKQTRFQ